MGALRAPVNQYRPGSVLDKAIASVAAPKGAKSGQRVRAKEGNRIKQGKP